MRIAHDPLLVLLSLVVAMQASYVGLRLALRVADATGLQRKLCLAGSALSLGVGVWSMHFVGMLAARLPVTIDYLVLPTLISFLVCVLVVVAADAPAMHRTLRQSLPHPRLSTDQEKLGGCT